MGKNNNGTAQALHIQFLYFEGCPLAGIAKTILERALLQSGFNVSDYDEVNILDPSTAESQSKWGSPTILVNGNDVTGHTPSDSICCRIYDTPEQVPTEQNILEAIEKALDS